ncbi:MAG: thioredoxin family protein [bacterium]|nr:thioredoxin family protein [bacterium]
MDCPHCGQFVPDANYRCPSCNKVVQGEIEPSEFQKKAARRSAFNPNIVVMVLVLLGVVFLAFVMISKGGEQKTTPTGPPETNAATAVNTGNETAPGGDDGTDTATTVVDNPGSEGDLDTGYVVNAQAPGEEMSIADYIQGDQTTIFDFYSEGCGPCRKFSPWLKQLDKKRSDIVVFKVDINRPGKRGIDWKSPLAQQYGLRSIPHFKIYDSSGVLSLEGKPAYDKVVQYLRSEGIIR